MPCGTRLYRSVRLGGSGPMSEPIGQRLMLSTPPAYTRSYAPDAAPCAARFTAVWPDPQKRFRLTPAISIGQPAARTAARATQAPCSPVSVTQPMIASSIRVGSTPVRATMACIGTVQRSIGCTPARPPPLRPRGVRQASMMKAFILRWLTAPSSRVKDDVVRRAALPVPYPYVTVAPCR